MNIPTSKQVGVSLTYIYGLGPFQAARVCDQSQVPATTRVRDLTEDEIARIRGVLDKNYTVEGALRREYSLSIKRLLDLGCYRGLRHRKGLPVRGQRTSTNARTRKGKARPIAGKKG